jgi:carbon storage regulator
MLILSRKLNESIVIDGRIIVKILRIERDTVKLGIQAPVELPVHRQEVYDLIQRNKQAGQGAGGGAIPGAIPKSPIAHVTPPNENGGSSASSRPPGSNSEQPK